MLAIQCCSPGFAIAYDFIALKLAMAEQGSTPCPVLAAWAASETVLKRLLEKNLLILNGSRLTRGTVLANRELLVPFINLVGC